MADNRNDKQWFEEQNRRRTGGKKRPDSRGHAKKPQAAPSGNKAVVRTEQGGKKRTDIPRKKGGAAKQPAQKKPAQPSKPVDHSKPVEHAKPAEQKKPDSSPSAKQKKRVKKRALRTAVFAVIVVLLSILVLRFVRYHLFNYIADKPSFSFVTTGTVEHTIGARALIVRDEEVIIGGTAGDLVTQATEGSRVARGQNIAMIVPPNMESVVTSLRNTQSQISEVQQELLLQGDAEGADSIYDSIDERIGPIVDMLRLDAMNGNVSDMSSYSSSIAVLISQRERELSDLQLDDERLRILRGDQAGYEQQLQRESAMVNSDYPGVISFKLDGLEETINYDFLMSAPASDIANVISSSTGIITSDLYVERNEPLARIASNEKQYIAVFLDPGDAPASAFEVGTEHTLNVGSEGISIGRCVVERVLADPDGLLIVFSTTRYVEDMLDLRTVDIEIVITESTGMRVPISSLVDADFQRGVANIYVNNKGFADSVGVLIIDYDREFAIIEPIGDSTVPNLRTVYIVNPTSVRPGDKVD